MFPATGIHRGAEGRGVIGNAPMIIEMITEMITEMIVGTIEIETGITGKFCLVAAGYGYLRQIA